MGPVRYRTPRRETRRTPQISLHVNSSRTLTPRAGVRRCVIIIFICFHLSLDFLASRPRCAAAQALPKRPQASKTSATSSSQSSSPPLGSRDGLSTAPRSREASTSQPRRPPLVELCKPTYRQASNILNTLSRLYTRHKVLKRASLSKRHFFFKHRGWFKVKADRATSSRC